ncbi:MAG: AMP-binding protein, partial [Candidatus Hydrogenedentes bacterium]|nr:AMP-binding protein [Candidatus Hydrogenedentota bacterium]
MSNRQFVDLVDCLEHWAQAQPETTLFEFLDVRGQSRERYTYRQFHERVSGVALQLAGQAGLQYGERVLLVYPPGLEMLVGFFASLSLGAIPVPVCAPLSMSAGAGSARIEHVARDCQARLALTTANYLQGITRAPTPREQGPRAEPFMDSVRWLATDTLAGGEGQLLQRRRNGTLFLQYTSGSTGDPKGVIVTHRNVIHNAGETLRHCPVGVSWLPQYHDMGLIGHYLFVVVKGGTNYGFSPFDFLKRPTLWFQTISRVRATLTTAPNFAYGYCLREDKVPDSALHDVDLSSLKGMLNAAEPIHPETYTRFYERFARYGLPREAYYGGYGLAENTLAVSLQGRRTLIVQKQRLQQRQLCIHETMTRNNNQLTLVSCGRPFSSIDVRIVDPESRVSLGENAVGEIWIDGESKCEGYWQRPELSESIFHARIEGEPDNPRGYLRTGDLGFLHEGELYVCGRIKDMIIIHGTNYYPQDIEDIVETEFPDATSAGGSRCAAFAVDHEGEEGLVVVVEVRSQQEIDPAEVAQAIRSLYFIDPYQVVLVPPRTIAKTTSGKVARGRTRDRLLSGDLPVLASYIHDGTPRTNGAGLRGILNRIRELYHLRGDEEVTLTDIGLDSLTLVDLTLEIQRHFERRGLAHLVSELDARFLQRISVSELSRLMEVYEAGPDVPVDTLRIWLESRQQSDDMQERLLMQADAQWHPPAEPAHEAQNDPQSVLMTGGSGYFGPFRLARLLQRTACSLEVLVRAADPA